MKARHRTLPELLASGMKSKPYMREEETIDWMKLGVSAGETAAVADKYAKTGWKDWAKLLRSACSLMDRVLNERLAMLEPKAVRTLVNRKDNCKMVMEINYAKRVFPGDKEKELVTLPVDDFEDVVEAALIQTCEGCKRPDYKDCKYHDIYLKLCVPAFDDTGDQCPYQYDMLREAERADTGRNNRLVTE